ncbi:DEAD/DEAH box helicase [Cooperia oncophora]
MTGIDRIFEDQKANIAISHDRYRPFSSIDALDQTLAENLRKMKYDRLLPMQAYAISVIMDGAKLVVRAPTGSGKTAAFLIPAIQRVIDHHEKITRRTQLPLVLIIGNTQNLMEQTYKFACSMAGYEPDTKVSRTQVRILDLFSGGYGMSLIHRHSTTIDHEIVIATCGGVLKATDFGKLNLSELQLLIIDEADKMTDSSRGAGYDVSEILSRIPEETRQKLQVVELSATFCEEENNVVLTDLEKDLFGADIPVFIDLPAPKGYVTQRVIEKGERTPLYVQQTFDKDLCWLVGLIEADLKLYGMKKEGPFKKSTVIFVEKKITSNYLALFLQQLGYCFEPMNSDYTYHNNKETIENLLDGKIQGLVATNKIARGQDIPDVDHVIIYEMAESFNDYKHRIGRTGRMGQGGRATVMFNIQKDEAHIVPFVDFLKYHNQIIPQWLWDLYCSRTHAEQNA